MVCLAALFCATTLTAQPPRAVMTKATPAQKAQRMTERLNSSVGLTADQAKQVQAICTDFFTREAALRAEYESLIKKALTPEQWQKMDELRQPSPNRLNGAYSDMPIGNSSIRNTPEENSLRMTRKLHGIVNLTDEQTGKVQAIYTDFFTREAALQAERETAIGKALTPEQRKNLEEMRQRFLNARAGERPQPKPRP